MERGRSILVALLAALAAVAIGTASPLDATLAHAEGDSFDIVGPVGSGHFGWKVIVLSNGNFVVTDPGFSTGGFTAVGAVYLYDGTSHALISRLIGSSIDDLVGSSGIVEVGTSDFVVVSPMWNNGGQVGAGALTWVDGFTGLNGVVSSTNSMVGLATGDLSDPTVIPLTNGNYVVADNGWGANHGAVRWGSGQGGSVGPMTSLNSLVGAASADGVGGSVMALDNGNYVLLSKAWNNNRGAVTWADGVHGTTVGTVDASNSLVGGTSGDQVGTQFVALANGNYVVSAPAWTRTGKTTVAHVGAATWRPGDSAAPATVDVGNSLVGSHVDDGVGNVLVALTNGNYAIGSPSWDDLLSGTVDVGAATWGDGAAGTVGLVSALNSLVGTTTSDLIGQSLVALANGSYVDASGTWNDGAVADVGAVTWRTGTAAAPATVATSNSLVGSAAGDRVGRVTALTNGHYVVSTLGWRNSGAHVGAVTWADGTMTTSAVVNAANSLIGKADGDYIGFGITPLTNGNYVVESMDVANGAATWAGAVTWRDGSGPSPGVVSSANSLLGSTFNDFVGKQGTIALPDGNYVITVPTWDNGNQVDAGLVAWGNGWSGSSGVLSSANAMTGSKAGDGLGGLTVSVLPDSDFVVVAGGYDITGLDDVGVATVRTGADLTGPLSAGHGVVGGATPLYGGISAVTPYTSDRSVLVARRTENIVTVLTSPEFVSLAPARLADTRPGYATVDGVAAGTGPLAAGTALDLPVTGRGGVATDAVAVSLNVTATGATAAGYVTVYPCGATRPTASNLNFVADGTTPNGAITAVGASGHVCLFVSAPTSLVVDVNGYFGPLTSYHAMDPARIVETRPGEITADGQQQGGGAVGAGSVTEVQVTGRVGLPAALGAAALNVTVTNPAFAGYATVFPCGGAVPTASSLNYTAGATVANLVVSKIGAGGKVCIFTQAPTDLIVDVNGYFPMITGFRSLIPARLLESRSGLTTIDGLDNSIGLRPAGFVTQLVVAGRGGVPLGAATVVLNVTVTEPIGPGYVTVYPCGIDPPLASNLNFVTGSTIPNAVIVKVAPNGQVCLVSSQPTHLVVDVVGYFPT